MVVIKIDIDLELWVDSDLQVQNEIQPTISNLPLSQYFNTRTAQQVE